jgi:hypothetical protein
LSLGGIFIIKTINLSHPRKALVDTINSAIFEAKLNDIKFDKAPGILGCIMGCILLNQDYVYAKNAAQECAVAITSLYKLGAPTLLTAVEIYKVRAFLKMYIENLKLYLHETQIST